MIAAGAAGKPILDVGCGSGRNALLLAHLGCNVICVDKDLTRLRTQLLDSSRTSFRGVSGQLRLHQVDIVKNPWPFGTCTIGGIICIHFFVPVLIPCFESSLLPGGYLLLETFSGCGGNYLELPKAGEVRDSFGKAFDLEFYRERTVGLRSYNAVAVKMLARRRGEPMSGRAASSAAVWP